MEIAQPQWRHRLWSVRDNQIAFYLTRLRESREIRRRNCRSWISSWQLPTSEEAR
jgi:hypothetical protein